MANQRIVNYVKTQLSRGFTIEQIKQGLVSQGWPGAEVEEASKVAIGSGNEISKTGNNPSLSQGNQSSGKQIPLGVKIIGILYYIGMGLLLLGGGLIILEGGSLSVLLGTISPRLAVVGGIFIIVAIPLFIFAALYFFLGRGMWKGQKWARIVAIILTLIGLVGSIVGLLANLILPSVLNYNSNIGLPLIKDLFLVPSILGILLGGWITVYLLFSKKVREAFA